MRPPELREHDGIWVLRDDLIEGGTKVRVAPQLLASNDEWVFAGPSQGYAQLALAIACERTGKRGVFFTAKRNELMPLTQQSKRHGLRIVEVPAGRISVVQARAREYCAVTGATFIPLGLKLPGMEDALYELALSVREKQCAFMPPWAEVWVTAGSGTLTRALARAWPEATIHAVQIGMKPQLPERAVLHKVPEQFAQEARFPPPFPSASYYDAKAWQVVSRRARHDGRALFWNVGS